MEVALQAQSTMSCGGNVIARGGKFRIKPSLGFFPNAQSSQLTSFLGNYAAVSSVSFRIAASADFSKRRFRKATSRSKGPASKGFVQKTQAGTAPQRRDQNNAGRKAGSSSPARSKQLGPTKKIPDKLKVETDKEQTVDISQEERVKEVKVGRSNQVAGNGSIGRVDTDPVVSEKKTATSNSDINNMAGGDSLEGKQLDAMKGSGIVTEETVETEKKAAEDLALKLEREATLRKQEIEGLAEENFSRGNKLFVYPQLVKPDQDIELFLNRSLSTLNNEPDVFIMGAFNDWRWKSFTIRLNKTQLKGGWWSCQLNVPKEAYKIDFVFFNGQNVYDNNDKKDFCVHVEGGIDAFEFEDFLLEEKHREHERLAKEQAERDRQVEEQRRMEAERAASEADRAQAVVETKKEKSTDCDLR